MAETAEVRKIGIAVDNYKIERFKKRLAEENFTVVSVLAWSANVSFLHVSCSDGRVRDLYLLCKQLQEESNQPSKGE